MINCHIFKLEKTHTLRDLWFSKQDDSGHGILAT